MRREELIARRQALGLSRRRLAGLLGLAYRTIQDWELGNREGLLVHSNLVDLSLCEIERRAGGENLVSPEAASQDHVQAPPARGRIPRH